VVKIKGKKEGRDGNWGVYIYIYITLFDLKKKMVGIPVLKAINLSIYISLSTNSFKKKKKTLLKKIKHDPQDIFIIYNTS